MGNEKKLVDTLHEICNLQSQLVADLKDYNMWRRGELLKRARDILLRSYRERFAEALDVDHQRVAVKCSNGRGKASEVPWILIAPKSHGGGGQIDLSDPQTGWFVDFLFSSPKYGRKAYIVILFGVQQNLDLGRKGEIIIGEKRDKAQRVLGEGIEYLDGFETCLPNIGKGKYAKAFKGAAIRSVELVLNDLDDEQVIEKVCRALQGLALVISKNIT